MRSASARPQRNANLFWGATGNGVGPLSLAQAQTPTNLIVLAEAYSAFGFEEWSTEYLRGANRDPKNPNDGGMAFGTWHTTVGTAKQNNVPDATMAPFTRHALGNIIIFADGHVR